MLLDAVAGTDSATVWLLPAATLNGEAGEVVVPVGNPESVTAAEPVNPFKPVIEAVKVELDVPAPVVTALGDRAMLKFSTSGGVELGPLLQAIRLDKPMQRMNAVLAVFKDCGLV